MKKIRKVLSFWRKQFTFLFCLSIVLVQTQPFNNLNRTNAVAAVHYIRVATTGSNSSACGGDASPCRTIQYAVNKASSGDIITVAMGTYTYDPTKNNCTWAITSAVVCFVDKNLTILGGYTISDWSTADPQNHVTIIDGQNTVRGVIAEKYNSTASLDMEGFTIQNGLSQGANTTDDYNARGFGGGMWSQKASLILRDMIFKNNRAIGADRNNKFGGYGAGGGLAVEADLNSNLPIVMENVVFQNNQALGGIGTDRGGIATGGGVFISGAFLTASDLVVDNNLSHAGSSTGIGKDTITNLWADSLGGGIALAIGSGANLSRITLTNNRTIGGNAGTAVSSQAGSGLGGAIYIEQASVNMYDSVIRGNTAQGGTANIGGLAFGGGMNINYATMTVDRTQIVDNLALSGASSNNGNAGQVGGGGIYLAAYESPGSGHLTLTNTVIADNGVQVGTPGNTNLSSGAGMTIWAVTADIVHCTFNSNQFITAGKAGQAISVEGSGGPTGVAGVANISYTIISNHVNSVWPGDTSALTVYGTSSATLDYVMFFGNSNNTNINNKPVSHGTINQSNILTPPNPIGYISPGDPNYDYHIISSSPAVDQAVGSTTPIDIDGQVRPYGPVSDIGADEYVVPNLSATPNSFSETMDDSSQATRNSLIGVSSGPAVSWTATTDATWLYLGPSGTSQQATGQTGDNLVIQFAPVNVGSGTYDATIQIDSDSAISTTITVHLLKVDILYTVSLPLVIKP